MQPLPPEEARRDGAEDAQWSRPECQAWTGTLLLGTGLLYCARVSVPVCAVSMSQDFGWNKKEAGVVLSSFFWGYCLTQVVGGHLGDRIGGEKVILLSASAWGFITAATPLLARLSSAHLVLMTFSRILTGLLQGVYFPALTSLLSQKVRESERAFTYSAVGAGSQFGTLVTGAVGSLLLDRYGWPSVFYLSGGLTLLWVCYVHRSHPGLGRSGARPAGVQAHQSSLETAFPEALCLGSHLCSAVVRVRSLHPPLLAADLLQGDVPQLQGLGLQRGALAGGHPRRSVQRVPLRPSHQSGLQNHHCSEVHAGREVECSRDLRVVTPPSPDPESIRRCPGSVLGAGLADLRSFSQLCPPRPPHTSLGLGRPHSPLVGQVGVSYLLGRPGRGFPSDLAQCAPGGPGRSPVGRHQSSLPQVMGLGLSSVFALCLGHTSSFCKSVVFASASIGLQTFNHSGISVNIQDLAPSCAGFLFGVANTAGALAGVVGVCLGGYLIETTGSWTSMFSLVAAISSLGLCIFLLFGEAQRVDLSPTHEDL
ncbi:solute carrier family 17 member 9 isoform X1 [Prionailurus viverrinus]|uniref:solute carrier family 17 member 9 isoform X1 n=1 Tax=Prionailurus viverrinus TaxID=61388 RepID=UPI001FF65BB6|nr:solute carrier family 17 member 9 isoform X1 [Prionailurus viverrinus]